MNENKGLNFIVGMFSLWLLYLAYTNGILHQIGFMAVNDVTGYNLTYSQDETVTSTPLALFVNLAIEAISAIGSVCILVSSGLWSILLIGMKNVKEMLVNLTQYIKEMKGKSETLKPTPKDEQPVEADNQTMLFELLKDIRTRLTVLENKNVDEKSSL